MRLFPLVLALLFLTGPGAASAATVEIGGISFEIPKGWEREDADSSILFTREYPETEDAERASALIQIVRVDGAPASFASNFAELVATLPELATEDPIVASAGTTAAGHAIRTEIRCCDHSRDVSIGQTVTGIAGDDAQVFVNLLMFNTSSDHEDAVDLVFEALVRSIRFPGDGDVALAPAEGDGGLEGAYTTLRTGLMPNVFGGLDFTVDNAITIFDPDGLFATQVPPGGDIAAFCAASPVECGTYRLTGGGFWSGSSEIEMRSVVDAYGTIEIENLSFGRDGDNLVIGEEDYNRLPPFPDGTTFSGSWTYSWASSGMTASSSGSVAVERTLVFGADGTFVRDGWSGGSSSGDMGGVTVSSDGAGDRGTYAASGYELTLTGSDGSTETLSLFAPDIGSDEVLVIDGDSYLKDD